MEFIIEQGHRVSWVFGSLDSRVTGSLGHKVSPSSMSVAYTKKLGVDSRLRPATVLPSVGQLDARWRTLSSPDLPVPKRTPACTNKTADSALATVLPLVSQLDAWW